MMTSQEILKLVDSHLDSLIGERQPRHLRELVEYVLGLDGKRIRLTFILLVYDLYQEHPEDILVPACGIETYHSYTLLYDGFMGQAGLRRSHGTAYERWDANTAIFSGDLILVPAYQRMAQYRLNKLKRAIDLFT